ITALGENAAGSLLTMDELYRSKAVLVMGNDPTNQNPLVAWQIRSGIRHHGTKLYVINASDIKLKRVAKAFVRIAAKQEAAVVKWMAHGEGPFSPNIVEQLVTLKAELEAESELAIVFGSEVSGAAISQLVAFASKLPYKVRFM